MPRTATMSVLGLYRWDNTIFDSWIMPEAIDMDILKGLIFQECNSLEMTIPNPALFKTVTGLWSRRKNKAWTRAIAAMNAVYNPIHNYDRAETYTDEESGSSGTDNSISGSQESKVAAFNSSTYEPQQQQTSSTEGESDTTYGRELEHTAHVSGNIGVTTSQQMVEAELDLSKKLDIYRFIVEDFKQEFCLMVY